jgi:hypothetical protein
MINDVNQLFTQLLKATELRKVDFKRDQYLLNNDGSKSEFIKDIVCMANAPGGEGYLCLGVKSEKGKPRAVHGVSHHHDSSDLEAIVNGVINEPIHFEYYPLTYQSNTCALIYIPTSKAKPHWPNKNYGVLKKHIIYTRRASANREASLQEIREMCIETIRVSDIADRKAKSSSHVIDEFADFDLDKRKFIMYKTLKRIAPRLMLTKYNLIKRTPYRTTYLICALLSHQGRKGAREYAVFMYPWIAKRDDIISSYRNIEELISGPKKYTGITAATRARIKESMLIHVSYKNLYTKAIEKTIYSSISYQFANEWNEIWGRVIKWEGDVLQLVGPAIHHTKKSKYEFFLANVTSKAELKERLEKLIDWSDTNIG